MNRGREDDAFPGMHYGQSALSGGGADATSSVETRIRHARGENPATAGSKYSGFKVQPSLTLHRNIIPSIK
jgi:hypothetical protein